MRLFTGEFSSKDVMQDLSRLVKSSGSGSVTSSKSRWNSQSLTDTTFSRLLSLSVSFSLAPAVVEVDGKEQGLACVAALIKYMEVRSMNTLIKCI